MKKTYVKFDGANGFFVKEHTMNGIEDRLHTLMASGATSKGPSELIELNTTLATLRQALQTSQDELKAAKADVTAKSRDINQVKDALGAARRVLDDSKSTWSLERKGLIQKLQELQLESSKLKIHAKNEAHSGDPEAALAAENARQLNAANIQDLQNKLQASNKEHKDLENTVLALESQLIKLRADHTAALEKNRNLENAFESQGSMDFSATTRKVEINSAVVKGFLGKKGLDWLQQADLAVRTDYRDRAFKLMQAARSAQSKSIKTFGDLFEIVFQWIKRVPHRVAKKIRPWIDEIEADFKSASLKTLKYYREALEAIIQEKVSLTNAARKGGKARSPDDKEEWYYTIFYYSWAIERRAIRLAKRTGSASMSFASSFWSTCKSSFRKFLLLWRSSSHVREEDLLYEAEEEEKLLGEGHADKNVEHPPKQNHKNQKSSGAVPGKLSKKLLNLF